MTFVLALLMLANYAALGYHLFALGCTPREAVLWPIEAAVEVLRRAFTYRRP